MGSELKIAENGKNIRLPYTFPPSRSGRVEDEYDLQAVEMESLPKSFTDSKYAKREACIESDSEESGETTPYTSPEPIEACVLYTPAEEAAVIRLFDRHLVLFIAILYMLSFWDRSSMLLVSSSMELLLTETVRYRKRKDRWVIN